MTSFEDFGATRGHLLKACGEVEDIWTEFVATRSPVVTIDDVPTTDDPVRAELAEARLRLDRHMIEVGVFGDIKRGKSTLVNALLGAEVSSTGVTPETAVPVYIENGPRSATVYYADGKSESFAPEEALGMASQRYQENRKQKSGEAQPAVVRVLQNIESDLLRAGMRLIDTPGLSDPSMSKVFEDLTFSELDRTAAAIIVLLYPPGIAANETELLRGLSSRRVDKAFIVCNFGSPDPDVGQESLIPRPRALKRPTLPAALLDRSSTKLRPMFSCHTHDKNVTWARTRPPKAENRATVAVAEEPTGAH